MATLKELAKRYIAFEEVDVSPFQRKARILQSMWREKKGYQIGTYKGKERGSYLPMPWAKETLSNYLTETIRNVVRKEIESDGSGKLYGQPRIYNNLLSSQPLCFNLFAELQQDLLLATKVFTKLAPEAVKEVTGIKFEYSPGRGGKKYLGDKTAFDVYVEFKNFRDEKGFIGIEVKYHEALKDKPAKMKDRYFEVAKEMGCFKENRFDVLPKKPLEQIWRDHLLCGSMLKADNFKTGFYVFVYPKANQHCEKAVTKYKKCLSDETTFKAWTLEDVAKAIKEQTDEKWIDELIDRYLNFHLLG
jgi:PD-(D/E)XK nuclease superfamily